MFMVSCQSGQNTVWKDLNLNSLFNSTLNFSWKKSKPFTDVFGLEMTFFIIFNAGQFILNNQKMKCIGLNVNSWVNPRCTVFYFLFCQNEEKLG